MTKFADNARDARQVKMYQWCLDAFGDQGGDADPETRGKRFLEEALELFQANGGSLDEATHIAEYVFGRPKGEVWQEIGGCCVTLYALGESLGLSVAECEEREIDRVLSMPVEHFQKRQREKRASGL